MLAAGSQPNFFRTPGAEEHAFPLYSLDDATRLRSRILGVFEDADRDPALIDDGALNFVVVGGGPTGVEMAGALADMIHDTMTVEYHDLAVTAAQVHIVDLGHTLLGAVLRRGARLRRQGARPQGRAAAPRRRGHGGRAGPRRRSPTARRSGPAASSGAAASRRRRSPARAGLPQGRGGRIDVAARPDASTGAPGVYAIGDVANIPGPDGATHPQLGSVALQSGAWAADNMLADFAGKPRKRFHYHDKGIMAMIGRGAGDRRGRRRTATSCTA